MSGSTHPSKALLKVLVLHNSYRERGGEDEVVRSEVELLQMHGHQVESFFASNRSITGGLGSMIAAVGSVFSLRSYVKVRRLIEKFQPDVVHVHNFFPLLSPSIFYACASKHVAVVMTLHNYRIICPTASLSHNGNIVEESIWRGPWWAVRVGAYRGSRVATFVVALMIAMHKRIGTWSSKVTRLIALTPYAREKFIEAGIRADHIVVKPNFTDVRKFEDVEAKRGFLYVGRLSPEKGVDVLIRAARGTGINVRIVGAGPIEDRGADGVVFLGALGRAEVEQEMRQAVAVVVPSVCHEMFSLVAIEALANGVPVVASRLGTFASLVEDGVTGLLFDPGSDEDLREKLRWAQENPERMRQMGLAGWALCRSKYSPGGNYRQLVGIYSDAIAEVSARGAKDILR